VVAAQAVQDREACAVFLPQLNQRLPLQRLPLAAVSVEALELPGTLVAGARQVVAHLDKQPAAAAAAAAAELGLFVCVSSYE